MNAAFNLHAFEIGTRCFIHTKGTLPSSGIPHVIVNGVIVMKDSDPIKDVHPGQPIRFPVEKESRLEPLSINNWKTEFTTGVPCDFGGGVPGMEYHKH